MPLISIITPCYNDGIYLDDAFNSIRLNQYEHIFEHIIVNDGSTDAFTLEKLTELNLKGCRIIHQENKGLAAARNKGIELALGKYILPLDSDNKIIPDIFIKAANMMEEQPKIDAVYTDVMRFGDCNSLWKVGAIKIEKIINNNSIDACALLRKDAIISAGYYDENMPHMGNEDWDLWISLLKRDNKIVYLEEIGFYYRVRKDSMTNYHNAPGYLENREYLFQKHAKFIASQYADLLNKFDSLEQTLVAVENKFQNHKFRSILKLMLGRKLY